MKPPLNYDPRDAELFRHAFEAATVTMALRELRGVTATSDGVLLQGTRVLPESFSSPYVREERTHGVSRAKLLAKSRLLQRRRFDTPCVWITDDWSGGYFHWIADALPRLLAARDRGTLLLPHGFEELEYVRSSLEHFDVNVEHMPPRTRYVCDRLILPRHSAYSGTYDGPLMRELRELLRVQGEPGDRIYVSRALARKRRIVNEEEAIAALAEHGFRVVRFEEHSFEEQVAIASGARYLVGNHGAGLVNLLFMAAGTRVLELRKRGDWERNWFYLLASAVGVDYLYQTCEPATDDRDADLIVDIHALRENLRLMLMP